MNPGQTYREVRVGRRSIVLRTLSPKDLQSSVMFANTLVRERKTNPDLGIVSLDRIVSSHEQRKFIRRVTQGVRKKDVVSVGAFDGEKMVGNCDVNRRKPYDVHHTGVLGIAILDGYRGKGLGEAMIRAALAESRRTGVWLVELTVFANNLKARRLYQKLGFIKVGKIPDKISRGGKAIDELVMYCDLRRTDKSPRRSRKTA